MIFKLNILLILTYKLIKKELHFSVFILQHFEFNYIQTIQTV